LTLYAGQSGKARNLPYLAVREGDHGGRLRGMKTSSRRAGGMLAV
jgi:hypothetical protein